MSRPTEGGNEEAPFEPIEEGCGDFGKDLPEVVSPAAPGGPPQSPGHISAPRRGRPIVGDCKSVFSRRTTREPPPASELLVKYPSPGYKLVRCSLQPDDPHRLDPYTGAPLPPLQADRIITVNGPDQSKCLTGFLYPDEAAVQYVVRSPIPDPLEYGNFLVTSLRANYMISLSHCFFCRSAMPTRERREKHDQHTNDPRTTMCPVCRYPCQSVWTLRAHIQEMHRPDFLRHALVGKSGATVGGLRGCDYLFSTHRIDPVRAMEMFRPRGTQSLAEDYQVYMLDATRDSMMDAQVMEQLPGGGEPCEALDESVPTPRFAKREGGVDLGGELSSELDSELGSELFSSLSEGEFWREDEPGGRSGRNDGSGGDKHNEEIRLRLRAFPVIDESDIDLTKTKLLISGALPHRGTVEPIYTTKLVVGVMTLVGTHKTELFDDCGNILDVDSALKIVPFAPQIAYFFWKEDPLCHRRFLNTTRYMTHVFSRHKVFFSWLVSCPPIARLQMVRVLQAGGSLSSRLLDPSEYAKRARKAPPAPVVKEPAEPVEPPTKQAPRKRVRRPVVCDICGKLLQRSTSLKRHKDSHAKKAAKLAAKAEESGQSPDEE